MYAAEFPDRVSGLVLVAPAGVLKIPDQEADFFELIRRNLPAKEASEFDTFIADYLDFGQLFDRSESEHAEHNRKLGEYFLAASNASESPAQVERIQNNGGWMVQAAYLSMGKRHDYQPALTRIQAPTLVIHGENDILPESIAQKYADSIPGAKMIVLKSAKTRAVQGAGHFPFAEDPEYFSAVLGDFLDSIENRQTTQPAR